MGKTVIEIKVNTKVEETISGMKSLGEMKVIRKNKTIPMDRGKQNRGQITVETRFPKQLTLKQHFTLDIGCYTG